MAFPYYIFKVLIVGADFPRRRELTEKYCSRIFVDSPRLTIGVDFSSLKIKLDENQRIKLHIWDVGGEERYRYLLPTYSKGSVGVLIIYDITSKKSMNHIADYFNIIRKNTKNIPLMLIGNNCEDSENREVSYESTRNFAENLGINAFREISTKYNINIDETFKTISELMVFSYENLKNGKNSI